MLPFSIVGSAQITDGLTSLFLEITVAAVFIILVARLLLPVQSHSPNANEAKLAIKSSTENKRPPKALTLRIDNVPAQTNKALLEENLKSITDLRVDDLRSALDGLIVRSLVRRDDRFSCATVTVTTSLPEERFLKALQDCLKSRGFFYRCDCNFYGITPLYEGEESANNICDVIAVPGLASHAVGSWKTPGGNDIWLRDWLQERVPNTRVLLYGYDTRLLKNESTSSIEDLGRGFLESLGTFRKSTDTENRPILFIGHSLGGVLVKEALVRAYRSSNSKPIHKPLYRQCCGVLFFGVPHLGLRSDALTTIVNGQPNQALIDSIKVDKESEPSHFLRRISEDFARCFTGETRVVSFYECHRSPTIEILDGKLSKTGPKTLMVTRKSATSTGLTGVSDEDIVPMETDHSGLVKFESRGQDAYIVVRERIRDFVLGAARGLGNRPLVNKPQREIRDGVAVHQYGSTFGGTITVNGGDVSQGNRSNVYHWQ